MTSSSPTIPSEHATTTESKLRQEIERLGPWFHNMLVGGLATSPEHFLGDYPRVKWRHLEAVVPFDLSGMTVLDIGCNAGFFSQQMAHRGAARVLGIDTSDRYLSQARFAAEMNGCKIEFRKLSVYELDQIGETFDLVLFLGVFYHLRYPLLALDGVVEKVKGRLLVQSLLRPKPEMVIDYPPAEEYPFDEQDIFRIGSDFPRMHFIERSFAGDPTNWWLPNAACLEAMLRSAGLKIISRPEDETWLCEPDPLALRGTARKKQEMSGTFP